MLLNLVSFRRWDGNVSLGKLVSIACQAATCEIPTAPDPITASKTSKVASRAAPRSVVTRGSC